VDNPNARVFELPLLTGAERRQLVKDWNETATAYPRERCVQELFEEQVELNPQAVALICGAQELSYDQLNRRANQLPHYLPHLGVGPGVAVELCLARAIEMIVGAL